MGETSGRKRKIQKEIMWRVGDGNTINFWKDNWILDTLVIGTITPDTSNDLDEKSEQIYK